jgi:long-chain acyl-CoA synthetase
MTLQTQSIIAKDDAKTLYGLFLERIRLSPEHVAYRSFDTLTSTWTDITWQEVSHEVARWQTALAQESLEPGDRVALNLRNSKEWVFYDQAAMGLGLVLVPLYPDDRPDNVAYILKDADVKVLLIQNVAQLKRLKPSLTSEHNLRRIVINTDDDTELEDSDVCYLNDWLPSSSNAISDYRADPKDLASII